MRTVHLSRNKPCELGRRPAIEVELLVDMVSDGARFDRSECIRQPNVDSAMLALSSTKSGTSQRTSSSSSMNIVKRSTKVIIGVERRWRVVSWRSLEEHTMVMIDFPSSFPFTPVTRRREKRTDRFFCQCTRTIRFQQYSPLHRSADGAAQLSQTFSPYLTISISVRSTRGEGDTRSIGGELGASETMTGRL